MASSYVYVHLDTTSNSVLSKGLNINDFSSFVAEPPQNILLLEPHAVEGEYEPHTGLKVIRGYGLVEKYFKIQQNKAEASIKWIDFKDINFLQQLTPMEIAELLYFSHVTSQLHSPFFYKLQNNFVYFEKKDDLTKVYYRHLDDFYKVLGDKLQQLVFEKINERKPFYKAAIPVATLPNDFIGTLRTIFQEGVVLDLRKQVVTEDIFRIPIYVVEDQVKSIETKRFKKESQIGCISYNVSQGVWEIEQEEWELLPNLKQV